MVSPALALQALPLAAGLQDPFRQLPHGAMAATTAKHGVGLAAQGAAGHAAGRIKQRAPPTHRWGLLFGLVHAVRGPKDRTHVVQELSEGAAGRRVPTAQRGAQEVHASVSQPQKDGNLFYLK